MSSYMNSELQSEALKAGMDDSITKPLFKKVIQNLIVKSELNVKSKWGKSQAKLKRWSELGASDKHHFFWLLFIIVQFFINSFYFLYL